MNENKSINSLKKQLVAAVAMVCVAAVALGSSTYAWFAANNKVQATGMSVQAQGETGIVIKSMDNATSVWATTASAEMKSAAKLYPTSTANLSEWYHAKSDNPDKALKETMTASDYEKLATTDNYVVKKTFKIRSAAQAVPVKDVKLAINKVEVNKKTTKSESLDKSIRVGVKVGTDFYVYAPLAATDFTLAAKYITDNKTLTEKTSASPDNADQFTLTDDTIPANDDACIVAEIYLWFEGEDENCKSTNITATLDNLDVTVDFVTVPTTTSAP